jgi:hypothetical protein
MELTKSKDKFIFDYIEDKFGVSKGQISSKIRKREIVDSRRLYMYILREKFGMTFIDIGQKTNNHHSTVIANYRMFEDFSKIYPKITVLPYKDICFQLDIMDDSIEEHVEKLKEQIVVINQKIDKLLTIKQLTNVRKKLHSK